MSREERRNYERMMRNMERGPTLPPAAKARAERNAARRAARQPSQPRAPGTFTRRFVVLATLLAVAVGYLVFSILWPNLPLAAYAGVAASLIAGGVQVGLRVVQGRVANR